MNYFWRISLAVGTVTPLRAVCVRPLAGLPPPRGLLSTCDHWSTDHTIRPDEDVWQVNRREMRELDDATGDFKLLCDDQYMRGSNFHVEISLDRWEAYEKIERVNILLMCFIIFWFIFSKMGNKFEHLVIKYIWKIFVGYYFFYWQVRL